MRSTRTGGIAQFAISIMVAALIAVCALSFAPAKAHAEEGDGVAFAPQATKSYLCALKGNVPEKGGMIELSFNLPQSGYVEFTGTTGFSGNFKLYASNYKELDCNKSFMVNESIQKATFVNSMYLTSGRYYVHIESYGYSNKYCNGNVNFDVYTIPSGESFKEVHGGVNNIFQEASTIASDKTYKGQIALNDDGDYYKIVASRSGKLSATLTASLDTCGFYLMNSVGSKLEGGIYSSYNSGVIAKNLTIDVTPGTYYMYVCKNWTTDQGIYTFSVTGTAFSNKLALATISSVSAKIYTGKAIKPAPTVKLGSTTLRKGTDYAISYKSNTNVGKATLTISGKGKYTGSKSITFKINPKATSVTKKVAKSKGFTVTWKKITKQVTGYQVKYSTSKSMSGAVTKTVKSYKTNSYTAKKLLSKTRYYVKVRTYKTVNGTKYYSAWSSATTSVVTKK